MDQFECHALNEMCFNGFGRQFFNVFVVLYGLGNLIFVATYIASQRILELPGLIFRLFCCFLSLCIAFLIRGLRAFAFCLSEMRPLLLNFLRYFLFKFFSFTLKNKISHKINVKWIKKRKFYKLKKMRQNRSIQLTEIDLNQSVLNYLFYQTRTLTIIFLICTV